MIQGQWYERALSNKERLLDDLYSYPSVFENDGSWPGDFIGRAILGLSSLYFALDGDKKSQKEIKEHLELIFSHLNEYTNQDGYFGPAFRGNSYNEQQFSGNSWYIRGLCSYYEINHDKKVLSLIKKIVESFLLPVSSCYENYPVEERCKDGGVSGHIIIDDASHWMLSSDVGCAFILLDGYVAAYELTRDPRLEKAIRHIIATYEKIDYKKLKFQTHATLTCARAILRFFEATGNSHYHDLAKSIFRDYLTYGLTLDHENYNWFGRPDSWTEPCCVIDSWILSKSLYRLDKDPSYLHFYNLATTNGLRTFQRCNGGAGCSTCATDESPMIEMAVWEAYFCCSMRLGEGFRYLMDNVVFENDTYFFYLPASYQNEDFSLQFEINEDQAIRLSSKKDIHLAIHVPEGFKLEESQIGEVKNGILHIDATPGSYELPYELIPHEENGLHYVGDLLYSKKEDGSLSPIYDSRKYEKNEIEELIQYLR